MKKLIIKMDNLHMLTALVSAIRDNRKFFADPSVAEVLVRAVRHKNFLDAPEEHAILVQKVADTIPHERDTFVLTLDGGKYWIKTINWEKDGEQEGEYRELTLPDQLEVELLVIE